jgi:hypothetical protein
MTGFPVVLAAVVDGHPHAHGQGGLAVADGLAAVVAALVGRDAELRVEPVEGLLSVADGVALEVGVGVVELVGQAGVVVTVPSLQVAAEAVGDLVDWTTLPVGSGQHRNCSSRNRLPALR